VTIPLTGSTPAEQLQSLNGYAKDWPPATSLRTLRQKPIFGTGAPHAELMIIGDAPGFDEEMRGEPFVGKGGQKLTQILKAMKLQRQDLYITNICKFRPAVARQTTNSRKPSQEEMAACMPLLLKEIEIVQPKCIVALGAPAAMTLLPEHKDSIAKLLGEWQSFNGIPLRLSYHPDFLLRNEQNLSAKRKLWEDMLAVMEHLSLPISEKQRSFFK